MVVTGTGRRGEEDEVQTLLHSCQSTAQQRITGCHNAETLVLLLAHHVYYLMPTLNGSLIVA